MVCGDEEGSGDVAPCEVEEIGLLAEGEFAIGVITVSGMFTGHEQDLWLYN